MECYQIELAKLHQKYNLQVDTIFPAEIMTFVELKAAIEHTNHFDISIEHKIEGKDYDYLFWAHAISDKKIGFIGNGKVLSSFIKESRGNIYRWRDQIIQQLQIMDVLPDYLILTFSGLSKEDVMYIADRNPCRKCTVACNYNDIVTCLHS